MMRLVVFAMHFMVAHAFVLQQYSVHRRPLRKEVQLYTLTEEDAYAVKEMSKYTIATGLQYGVLLGLTRIWDAGFQSSVPAWFIGILYASLSLRSRIFSPLDNSRPKVKEQEGKALPIEFKRPKWTPPGIAFPIIWSSISLLRAISSAIIYKTTGSLDATAPLLLHLCIGDTWNTITNVERRLGVSAMAVFSVWASVLYAVTQYYSISNLAGFILAPSFIWISIASILTTHIWLLNGGPSERPPFPSPTDGSSAKFLRRFFSSSSSSSAA